MENIKRVCNKCGEVNYLQALTIKKQDAYDEAGEHYRLIWYVCKRCKEKNFVQIDNNETIEIFRKLKALIIKVQKKRLKGETVSPKDVKKKDKLNKELNEKRAVLMEVCNGKKMYDIEGKVLTEHLTFYKESDILESNL